MLDNFGVVACLLEFSPLWPVVEHTEVFPGKSVSFVSVLKCVPRIDVDVML